MRLAWEYQDELRAKLSNVHIYDFGTDLKKNQIMGFYQYTRSLESEPVTLVFASALLNCLSNNTEAGI